MPGRGKGKARGKSRGRKKSESLQWKIRYRISSRYLEETGETLAEARAAALEHFESEGEQLDGTQIIVSWRNKNNKNPKHSNWKSSDDAGQSLGGAFRTLHGSMARAQSSAAVNVPDVRPVMRSESRSAAMKQYHAELREIAAKHPSWRHEKVREEYRKKRKQKRKGKK